MEKVPNNGSSTADGGKAFSIPKDKVSVAMENPSMTSATTIKQSHDFGFDINRPPCRMS